MAIEFYYANEHKNCEGADLWMRRLFLETSNNDRFWRGRQDGWKKGWEGAFITGTLLFYLWNFEMLHVA